MFDNTDWRKLLLCIVITQSAGVIGSIFTIPAIPTWYESLNRTPINPPDWLFAPMWTTLYLLMGVSLYLILGKKNNKIGLTLFYIQLGLNALWSVLFFGLKSITAGVIEIVFLWFFVLFTIIEFRQLDKRAAYLLIPYIAWVTIATILNLAISFYN
ncbi:MAG TPA: TspO/MBR family protein [Candidatus Nanoarchaeia archaeon]|nr:TspO/MBR family protein [Candidatus Nanoarchaeia archaeon]